MELFKTLKQDAAQIYSEEGLKERFASGKTLRIKMGADPSRPNLHLGHSVVLRRLKLLQDAGHEVIFVIGDFTAMIGDPTGRSRTRTALSMEETRRNGETYFEQVTKILSPHRTSVLYNSQWLSDMRFEEVLRMAEKTTLARVLERDDFATRMSENRAVGLHELLYPLIQGYDSVALSADIEVGGTDQTFNMLMGRDLQRDYGQKPQEVITFPILAGLDGMEKMSKSLGNTIDLCEPADVMYEKCMRVPDPLLGEYFRLTTGLSESAYIAALKNDICAAHFLYAGEIVRMYHGAEAAQTAEKRYRQVASGDAPDEMEELYVQDKINLVDVLLRLGLASSSSDARRLIAGGGIRLDGETVCDPMQTINRSCVISRGKNRFARILLR